MPQVSTQHNKLELEWKSRYVSKRFVATECFKIYRFNSSIYPTIMVSLHILLLRFCRRRLLLDSEGEGPGRQRSPGAAAERGVVQDEPAGCGGGGAVPGRCVWDAQRDDLRSCICVWVVLNVSYDILGSFRKATTTPDYRRLQIQE